MTSRRCILLLGAPRTGTSLIAAALGSNPAIAMLDEDFGDAVGRLTGDKIAANKLCIPNQVQFDRRWHRWYAPVFSNGYLRKTVGRSLPRSRLSVLDYLARFECQVVCVLRDPARAVDAIVRRERYSRDRAIATLAACHATFERIHACAPDACGFVSFDAFVQAPQASSEALCAWLRIPFDHAMLAAANHNRRYPNTVFDRSKAAPAPDASGSPSDLATLDTTFRRHLALAV